MTTTEPKPQQTSPYYCKRCIESKQKLGYFPSSPNSRNLDDAVRYKFEPTAAQIASTSSQSGRLDLTGNGYLDFENSQLLYNNDIFETIAKESASVANSIFDEPDGWRSHQQSDYQLNEYCQSSQDILRTFNFNSSRSKMLGNDAATLGMTSSEALTKATIDRICSYQMNPLITARTMLQPSKQNILVKFVDAIDHRDYVPLPYTEKMLNELLRELLPKRYRKPPNNNDPSSIVSTTKECCCNCLHASSYERLLEHGWLTEDYIKQFKLELKKHNWSPPKSSVFGRVQGAISSVMNFFAGAQGYDSDDDPENGSVGTAELRSIKEAPTRSPCLPPGPFGFQTNFYYEGKPRHFPESVDVSTTDSVIKSPMKCRKEINLFALAGVQQLPPNLATPLKPRNSKKKFGLKKSASPPPPPDNNNNESQSNQEKEEGADEEVKKNIKTHGGSGGRDDQFGQAETSFEQNVTSSPTTHYHHQEQQGRRPEEEPRTRENEKEIYFILRPRPLPTRKVYRRGHLKTEQQQQT